MPDHASTHGKTVLRELSPLHRELRRAIPDVYAGPATIHGPRAYDAFCEFARAREAGESAA